MQKGSLITLAKPLLVEWMLLGSMYGIPLPDFGQIYTVKRGPALTCCHMTQRGAITIQIEELDEWEFDASFFVEVQEPMQINLNEILVT